MIGVTVTHEYVAAELLSAVRAVESPTLLPSFFFYFNVYKNY